MGLRASLMKARDGMQLPRNEAPDNAALWLIVFAGKSMKSAETQYSNIEEVALGILHGLEKFHHYYFTHEVSRIKDHKLLMSVFKRDVASLPQRLLKHFFVSISTV